jgi:hypothetical protein
LDSLHQCCEIAGRDCGIDYVFVLSLHRE